MLIFPTVRWCHSTNLFVSKDFSRDNHIYNYNYEEDPASTRTVWYKCPVSKIILELRQAVPCYVLWRTDRTVQHYTMKYNINRTNSKIWRDFLLPHQSLFVDRGTSLDQYCSHFGINFFWKRPLIKTYAPQTFGYFYFFFYMVEYCRGLRSPFSQL